MVGLLPPGSVKGKQGSFTKTKLITFMQDDYPNNWQDEVDIEDNTWYSVKVRFQKTGSAVAQTTVTVANTGLVSTKTDLGVDVWKESNGPQLGVYNFDFGGGDYSTDRIVLDLAALSGPGGNEDRHDCEHGCLASAKPVPSSPSPRPRPRPTPTPTPTQSSCTDCLGQNSDWTGTCAWSRCAGCSGCPSQTKCEQWCTHAPPKWSEKCDWIYCNGCSSCQAPAPSWTPPSPPPSPPPPPPPTGPGFCCTWSPGGCDQCESHNIQDSTTWCGADSTQCSTCSGTWCER